MSRIKIVGLGILAALALLLIPGAASAPASAVLCSTNTFPCTGTKYGTGTKISTQLKWGTVAMFTTPSTNVTCAKATLGGSTNTSEGHGEITTFGFSSCVTDLGTPCTLSALGLPYTATFNPGSLTISWKSMNPAIGVDCGSLIKCTFSFSSLTLGVTGGNPATIVANNESLERFGVFCPSSANFHATYEVTAPKPLFLV
jgi:hypothetical protein